MLNDLDQRRAGHSAMSDSAMDNTADDNAPYISMPFNTASTKSKTSFIRIIFAILMFLLLITTCYYSYLIYTQQSKTIASNALPTAVAKKTQTRSATVIPVQSKHPQIKIANPPAPVATMSKPTSLPKPEQHAALTKPLTEIATDDEQSENEPAEPILAEENVNTDMQSVKKHQLQLSPKQQAEIAYTKGYSLLQQNKIYSAESKLLLALEHNINHIKAREILVGLYLKTGRKVEARDILQKGIVLLPSYTNFTKLYARLLLDNNETDQAVKILLQHKPTLASDPNYFALLAASYQRQKNHNAAASTYVELLKVKPREGIWWVGMAISLEALNKKQEALNAYEKARQTGTLNTRISNYSSQRLKQLNLKMHSDNQ